MRLISLSCNQPSFQTVKFNPTGLTIITGDGAINPKEQGNSNGVGKTLLLGLVHHCLGGNIENKIKQSLAQWVFTLTFSHESQIYSVERSGDGTHHTLNGKVIKNNKDYTNWLKEVGVFKIFPNVPKISFRSLIKRFTRYKTGDCDNFLKCESEYDFDAYINTLYLLGLDYNLAVTKANLKEENDDIKQQNKAWKSNLRLKDFFASKIKPQTKLKQLEEEISKLSHKLDHLEIEGEYRAIKESADALTNELRQAEKEEVIIKFQLNNIAKSLEQHPDISKNDLLALYEGLKSIFKPEALAHFDAVEAFHHSLNVNSGLEMRVYKGLEGILDSF